MTICPASPPICPAPQQHSRRQAIHSLGHLACRVLPPRAASPARPGAHSPCTLTLPAGHPDAHRQPLRPTAFRVDSRACGPPAASRSIRQASRTCNPTAPAPPHRRALLQCKPRPSPRGHGRCQTLPSWSKGEPPARIAAVIGPPERPTERRQHHAHSHMVALQLLTA